MSDIAIRVAGLGKAYRIGVAAERADTMIGALASFAASPLRNFKRLRQLDTFSAGDRQDDLFWAVKDLDFEIRRGETVGFVGRNGAGKSTLLKMLSRITEPTTGEIAIRGRVSSLLEVGTGFHPELTGRENIYMNGTILGMAKREIDRKFDEIASFSGVEKFLDTPVKRYSSGMKVRLGFSVAAHLEPEVLIIDEVLAVGDAEFQRRCLGKMEEVAGMGRTVLFVSHNLGAIQNLCDRAISLRDGEMVADGTSSEVVSDYLASFVSFAGKGFSNDNPDRETKGEIRLIDGRVLDAQGIESEYFDAGSPLVLECDYHNPGRARRFEMRFTIRDGDGVAVTSAQTSVAGFEFDAAEHGRVRVTLDRLPLPPGSYSVNATVLTTDHKISDAVPNALTFTVDSASFFATGRTLPRRIARVLFDQHWEASTRHGGHDA
ncbi:ABC transporter ATP-binding protein [Croceicoccus sp. F390]|uniref:ABC transporter ATP-binding protein n=1 Tax=Croceicoccus esteveae TaxID=3075597 RepID=A0ABU2ZJT2_9SPHN|nr:ABC transporter ATP-binding protein [Croceicoccus sp. F390]MDT0576866.1 ABC transporter ATP-binding protein [Croceicoccus sp. F390]